MDNNRNEWMSRTKSEEHLTVMQFCPARPYVEITIPNEVGSITRLTVITVSHDQGFSNDQETLGGTYEQSYTWFERNRNASLEPYRHENVLDSGSGDAEVAAWLSRIKGGDTIQLIPRAEFPAWVNFVLAAELEVAGVLEPETSSTASPILRRQPFSSSFYRELVHDLHEIRLLEIDPGHFNDPIICSLRTVALIDRNHIPFVALSYCWESPKEGRSIHLKSPSLVRGNVPQGQQAHEECEVFITSNLHDALRHLRLETGPPCLLWVDALCINQHDLGERSHQVSLMRSVYSSAERVVVWLGLASPESQHCFRIVKSIAERYASRNEIPERARDHESTARLHEPMIFQELLPFVHSWQRCEFAWFRRTWVLQEVANAQDAIVHCGHDTVPWPTIVRLADCIVKAKQQTELFRYTLMPPVFSRLFELEDDGRISRSNPLGILEVLLEGQALDASDPRDKLFALLQFGAETANMQDLDVEIRPNYHKPTSQVFTDFTRWWIKTHKSLRILSAVHTLRDRGWQKMSSSPPLDLSTLDHPTWCFWSGGTPSWAKATLGLSAESPFRASGSALPELSLLNCPSEDSRTLRLTGHRLCTVKEIGPYPLFEFDGRVARLRPQSEMCDAFISIFDPVGSLRTWIWEREDHKPRDRPSDSGWYRDHLMTHFVRVEGGLSLPCVTPCFFKGKNSAGDALVGLCPDGTRPGDLVVILHGGQVPYILRARQTQTESIEDTEATAFELVGECYLEGAMHGETMDVARHKQEVFHIV